MPTVTFLMLDSRTGSVDYGNDSYFYGQFMKFIRRGAAGTFVWKR